MDSRKLDGRSQKELLEMRQNRLDEMQKLEELSLKGALSTRVKDLYRKVVHGYHQIDHRLNNEHRLPTDEGSE